MAKYDEKAQEDVAEAMREYKHGKLKSRQQAIAVGLNKARKEGDKVPPAPEKKKA